MTTATASKMTIEQIDLHRPTTQDLQQAWELLKTQTQEYSPRFLLTFTEPVKIQVDRRNQKVFSEMVVRFFISKDDALCYTFHKKTGYDVRYLPCQMLESIRLVTKEDKGEKPREEQVESLLNRRHPNAWSHLTPEKVEYLGTQVVNIKSKFPDYVIEQLRDAFDNKTAYRHKIYGERRDLSVETKVTEDGEFRAWFSSEYSGCANGSYYLLINPTTATFREDD